MKNKKKIGAITFHSSYNHGSVLQAYALQEFIKREFGKHFDYQIINLRTERQKKYYEKSYSLFDIKNNAKNILLAKYKPQILERQKKYELFIKNKLCLTDEYQDADSLAKANFNYDYYLSGSDQIWNYTILDFDWSFFLEFCGEKTKKISYAASFGPKPLELDELTKNRLKDDLSKYKNISVREIGSANMIEEITGENSAEIHIDPTLLLKKKDWDRLVGGRIIKDDYILLYDLKANKNAYKIAQKLSKVYNIPVVVVKENAKMNFICKNFIKKYDAGPIEFLNYVKNAKIVVSSSFHGNVFSIIFEKPFLAVGGKEDYRIRNLLKTTKLMDRAVYDEDDISFNDRLFDVDFDVAKKTIEYEQERSKEYFVKALDIEGGYYE